MTNKKLIHIIDNSSASLLQLATLLQAQEDELQNCDDDIGGNSDNWYHNKDQIEVIGNIVMRNLTHFGNKFDGIAKNYYIRHDKH